MSKFVVSLTGGTGHLGTSIARSLLDKTDVQNRVLLPIGRGGDRLS